MEAVINLEGKMQQGEMGKGSDLSEGPCIPMAVSSGPCALALSPIEGMRSHGALVGHVQQLWAFSGVEQPSVRSHDAAAVLRDGCEATPAPPAGMGCRAAAVGKWLFSSLCTLTAGTVINNCSSYRDEQL